MKKRPLVVVLFAVVCGIYPVLRILQTLLVQRVGVGEAVHAWAWPAAPVLFRGENLAATAVAWFAAWAVYQVKGWSWWLGLLAAVALAGFNVLVFLHGAFAVSDAWLWSFALITVVPLLLVGVLIQTEIRTPYFNPRIRWWESEPRYPLDAEVSGGGRALDISSQGMFVRTDDPPALGTRGEYHFEVHGQPVTVTGEVSWVSEGDAAHPTGFGLRFLDPDEATRQTVAAIIDKQRAQGHKEWGEREVRYPLDIRCDDGAVVLDISRGGMFIQSDERRRLGDRVRYRLHYGSLEIPVAGQVVWLSDGTGLYPPGHGVRFGAMSVDERDMLNLLIRDLWKANLEPVERQV